MNARAFLPAFAVLLIPSLSLSTPSWAYLSSGGTAAVDVNGVWHRGDQYPGKLPPWMADRIKSATPDYPKNERTKRHSGVGYFQLILDSKTGAVTKVIVKKSSGFATLDDFAVTALRQWQWKPVQWREMDILVTFKLGEPPHLPKGSVSLPLR